MENVNVMELQQMINKAKYVYIYAPAVEAHVEVKKGNLKEIIKNQMINKNIDLNEDYVMAQLHDDELWIDTIL
jgi:hypothetical protein